MSAIERYFCCSTLWRATSAVSAYSLPVEELGTDILEIGAGSGAVAEHLMVTNPDLNLTVVDVDPHMVASASRRLQQFAGASAIPADATDLPFGDDTFDTVISCLMLHHVMDWEQAVSEAARVLRPGGNFVGYDLQRTWWTATIHRIDRSPHRLARPEELTAVCNKHGMRTDIRSLIGGQLMSFSATTPA